MSKSDDEPVRFVAIGGHSPWGTSREVLPDGTYLCQDASGGWYLDPVTGETDVAAMRGGTQWFGEKYRRRYVEGSSETGSRGRSGIAVGSGSGLRTRWSTGGRGRTALLALREENKRSGRRRSCLHRRGGVMSGASSVPALLRQGDVLLVPVAGIPDLGVVDSERTASRHALAEGEATGHAHVVVGGRCA